MVHIREKNAYYRLKIRITKLLPPIDYNKIFSDFTKKAGKQSLPAVPSLDNALFLVVNHIVIHHRL